MRPRPARQHGAIADADTGPERLHRPPIKRP
jgi:hypothetical protein